MKIFVPKETKFKENRVSLTPDVAKDLIKRGHEIMVESDAGVKSFFSNEAYMAVGAQVVADKTTAYKSAELVLKVNAPNIEEINSMKANAVLISFLFASSNIEIANALAKSGISSFAMEAIPRISRAQKMDALSSQANLAGYKSVIMAANTIGKILPMMTTAAGTIRPTKVVIFGAGVAGLQAIATAKRLGAVVEVSDIRPETKEQVESLGGKFIEVKGDESIKIEGGYVKGVSEEFLKKQQE